jgi:hypothetical protein
MMGASSLTQSLADFWQWAWPWLTWGNDFLRGVVAYGTFVGVMYTAWGFWRSRGKVAIMAVNADDPSAERRLIAKVPRSFMSRAEVMGLVGQAAGGERLDFTRFVFDYKARKRVVVVLPDESFHMLAGK